MRSGVRNCKIFFLQESCQDFIGAKKVHLPSPNLRWKHGKLAKMASLCPCPLMCPPALTLSWPCDLLWLMGQEQAKSKQRLEMHLCIGAFLLSLAVLGDLATTTV